jgi:hypothetical protein
MFRASTLALIIIIIIIIIKEQPMVSTSFVALNDVMVNYKMKCVRKSGIVFNV